MTEHQQLTPPSVHLLIVEDNPDDLELTLRILKKSGIKVGYDLASTPDRFEQLIRERNYDAVLCDYQMGNWTGLHAFELYRGSGKNSPFILVTGALGEDLAIECVKRGIDDYVLKDDLGRLPFALKRCLWEQNKAEENQAAERIRKSEERFRLMISQVQDYAIFMLDPEGNIVSWNSGAERIHGYKADEIIGQHFSCFYSPSDRQHDRPQRKLRMAADDGFVEDDGWRLRKDGSRFWAHVVITALLNESGQLCGFSEIVRDISDKKQIGDELRLLQSFNLSISDAENLDSALLALLQKTCDMTGWLIGQAWIPNSDRSLLEHSNVIYTQVAGLEEFQEKNRGRMFKPGEALPGMVWKKKKPEWIEDVSADPAHTQDPSLHALGLKAILGIPVLAGEEVVAVLEFFMRGPRREDEGLLNLISAVTAHLGASIQRKRAEAAQAESENRFRTLVELCPDAIFVVSDGKIILTNRAGVRLLGAAGADDLIGQPPERFVHPDYRNLVDTRLRELEEGGTVSMLEERYVRLDGSVVEVEVASVKFIYNKKPAIQVIARDITERKRAEKALQESEGRFRQLAETIDEVFWLSTPEQSRFIYLSPAFEKVWGFPAQNLYDDSALWFKSVHIEDRSRVAGPGALFIAASFSEEFRIVRPDGAVRWIRNRAFPIRDEKGEIYRMAGLAEDITRHKQLEAQFLQAQKMESIGRLAGGVAHDFRNLLTAIGSFAELAYSALPEQSPARGDIEQIQRATERAVTVTSQLLAFARKQHVQPEILNPATLLSNLQKMLLRLVREDIELVLHTNPQCGEVKVDAGQFEQVIVNMVINAVDAMPNGGRLTISTERIDFDPRTTEFTTEIPAGSYVVVSISDTGIGMTEEIRSHLFEPFFTTKGVGKGTGLGLATSYGIMKQNGGYIQVLSQPGEGTTFQIFLPSVLERPAEIQGAEKFTKLPKAGHETILLVEDQPQVRQLASQILQSHGYSLLEACNGEEALKLARQNQDRKIDLVLTDMVMPKIGGRELAHQLQFERPDLKVIFMSAYTEDNFGSQGPLDEKTPFLSKPFTPTLLIYKVREVLDTRGNGN